MVLTWQELAQAASVEPDSTKLMQLVEQLHKALDDKDKKRLRSRAA
jgi:hypothetical protein